MAGYFFNLVSFSGKSLLVNHLKREKLEDFLIVDRKH